MFKEPAIRSMDIAEPANWTLTDSHLRAADSRAKTWSLFSFLKLPFSLISCNQRPFSAIMIVVVFYCVWMIKIIIVTLLNGPSRGKPILITSPPTSSQRSFLLLATCKDLPIAGPISGESFESQWNMASSHGSIQRWSGASSSALKLIVILATI